MKESNCVTEGQNMRFQSVAIATGSAESGRPKGCRTLIRYLVILLDMDGELNESDNYKADFGVHKYGRKYLHQIHNSKRIFCADRIRMLRRAYVFFRRILLIPIGVSQCFNFGPFCFAFFRIC